MPKNDEGEFELVVGNRQLLSVFIIVVILFGVFFAMGYIVGRNSSPPVPATAGGRGTESASTASSAPASSPPQAPGLEMPSMTKELPRGAVETKPDPLTAQAARSEPRSTKPVAEPKPAETEKRPEKPAAAAGAGGNLFLQVAAIQRRDAEVLVGALKKKGFPALVAPGPNETIFRVLVGPFADAAAAARSKAELESAGFKPILKRPER